jgi:DNA-3-methyladenine glycosylase I
VAAARVRDEEGSLAGLIWRFQPSGSVRAPRRLADVPAVTVESAALSKELRRRGFRFVGPTTAYAFMQAMGLVNDHLAGCATRGQIPTLQQSPAVGANGPRCPSP